MYLSKLTTFILMILFMVACQPKGNVESSFGTKIPTNTDAGSTTGGSGGAAANLVSVVSGDKQNVAVGGTAALPLVVLVLQAPGTPVANESVYFQVVGGASSGSVSSTYATTNASGYAEVYFTGGSVIGDVNIVASAPQGSANFTTTVTGATGYTLSKAATNAGDNQTASINSTLAQRFKVVLTDSHGDPVAGQNIRFVSVGGVQGNFSGSNFYDSMTNASGAAESDVFTLSSTAGSHTVNAYLIGDSSVNSVFSAVSVTPVNSAIDPLKSNLTLSSGMVAADGMNTVELTLQIRDIYDNLIPNNTYAGVINVTGNPALMLGSTWDDSWTYTGVGTYKRHLTVGNTSGVVTFNSEINSIVLMSASPSLQLTANSTVDYTKTTITSTVSPLSADGVSTATLVVQLRDTFSNPINNLSGQSVVVTTDMGTLIGSMTYHAGTGTYRQLLRAPTSVGSGYLTATLQSINGVGVAGVTYQLPLQAAAINASNSSITIPSRVYTANSQVQTLTLNLKDSNNNGITAPATITMNKVIQSGSITGTFANSGNVTSIGNGVYQINLTSPSNTTTCNAVGVICTEDISATVTVGATTITLGPLRVQYKGAAMTPSAAHSYLVMDNSSVQVGSGNVLTGTIYLRTSTPDVYSVGGNKSNFTVGFTGCTPTYNITDNNSGTYAITLNSPGSSCSGVMTISYGGTQIGTTAVPGHASTHPFSFSFFGALSLGQSVLTINPSIISGGGSTTVTLEVKDDGGNNYPSCLISTSLIRFQENHADTAATGIVNCSVVGGKAYYTQSIERTTNPDEYGTVNISAQYDNSGWSSFASMKTLQLTPPNLAGYTIDCDNEVSFRDKNIYVKDGTLTINGWVNGSVPTLNGCAPGNPIRFKTLRVGPNGILTHSETTDTNAYGIDVEATESITVEASGKIDVIGKGYVGARAAYPGTYGRGPGNVASVPGSASHGGLGVSWNIRDTNSQANRQPTYGSSSDPNDLGSGAGRHSPGIDASTGNQGSDGGGLVRLKAPAMLINGGIFANGDNSPYSNYLLTGSGGAIKLDLGGTGQLLGSGQLTALGGLLTGYNGSFGGGGRIAILGDMTAWSGPSPSVLGGGNWTTSFPNPSYGTESNNGTLYISKVPANFTIPFPLTIGPNDSYFGGATNITIPAGFLVNLATNANWANVTINGTLNFLSGSKLNSTNVTVSSSGTITHEAVTTSNGNPKVDIEASGIIDIQAGGTVTSNSKGYYASGFEGYGFGWAVAAYVRIWNEAREGGNHYKLGGGSNSGTPGLNTSGVTWGNPVTPATYGGAGSQGSSRGGGIVSLVGGTIIVDGTISSSATGSAATGAAGSAGGSIYLEANDLDIGATSVIQAHGSSTGNWNCNHPAYNVGGGAGGLIGIKYHTLAGTINATVDGGMSWAGTTCPGSFIKTAEDGVVTITPF